MASDRRPVTRAPEAAWRRLGELLQLRRAELGYKRRPAFTRDRGINIRLVTDIENAYRPNTFLTPTLREIAQAYAVTYGSVIAVLAGHGGELVPAAPASPLSYLGDAPIADRARREADAPYAMEIMERVLDYTSRGIRNPSGTQLFPDSPEDSQIWDGIGARLDIGDRVWLIADLRRRAHDRRGGTSGSSVAGALRPSWILHTSHVRVARLHASAYDEGQGIVTLRSMPAAEQDGTGGSPGRAGPGRDTTMADPARRSAAGPEETPWGDARRQMMAAAQDVAAAAQDVAVSVAAYLAAGGDEAGSPAAMAALAIGVLQGVARRLDVAEAVIEAERYLAVAEDREVWPRRLRRVT